MEPLQQAAEYLGPYEVKAGTLRKNARMHIAGNFHAASPSSRSGRPPGPKRVHMQHCAVSPVRRMTETLKFGKVRWQSADVAFSGHAWRACECWNDIHAAIHNQHVGAPHDGGGIYREYPRRTRGLPLRRSHQGRDNAPRFPQLGPDDGAPVQCTTRSEDSRRPDLPTDTGNGGYTMRFFRSARSAKDLVADRDAIAAWARLTYDWMGRSRGRNAGPAAGARTSPPRRITRDNYPSCALSSCAPTT